MNSYNLSLAVTLLAVSPAAAQAPSAAMGPAQAIAAAAQAPAGEVAGTFEMVVGSAGGSGYQVFLNSAKDYHDPANLTIELDPGPRATLNQRLGGDAQDLMPGKRIRVTGVAKRVAVSHGSGPTVYQTRVRVERNEQIVSVQ